MNVSDYIIYTNHFDKPGIKNKNLYGPPYLCMGSTTSMLRPLRGGSLLFTNKFREVLGTHFINLGKMRG